MIKEIIVVEGRDDVLAVKKAVDAEIISVGGFGINRKVIEKIKEAQKRQGVIVFTDPDFAGEKIRKIITKRVKGVKHAYLSQDECKKGDDIGVENASPESIIKALKNAKCELKVKSNQFTSEDMFYFKLTGSQDSKNRRKIVGKELGIGYCNSAQFLSRLNNFGITRKEFIKAIEKLGD